jgi:large subunit ribosomal protein L35
VAVSSDTAGQQGIAAAFREGCGGDAGCSPALNISGLRFYKGRDFGVTPVIMLKTSEFFMPKMKTKSGAKKRFRVRPGGTVKRGQAFKRHILTKKTTKNKRHLRGAVGVHESDLNSVRAMLPFA